MSKFTSMGLVVLLLAGGGAEAGMMGPGAMMGRSAQPPSSGDTTAPRAAAVAEYCAACHAPPQPGLHNAEEWRLVLIRMERYMRAQGRKLPSLQEEHQILAYLDHAPEAGR